MIFQGTVPKRKNDDSIEGAPFEMSRFGHGVTQTTALSAIPMTRRHPDDALIPKTRRQPDDARVSNPQDTAPPRRRPGQQSPRHGATQTTTCSPILMTRRHPHHALVSNPQDTERTGRPAILMAQRHPRETSSNPRGTAPPTRHAQQQSPCHSGAHATRPAAIPMAQRRPRHTRDTPDAHRHSLPLRSTAQRRTRDTPDAACRCVPRNVRSKLTSANPRIPCACHDFATPNARPHTRFVARGHETP